MNKIFAFSTLFFALNLTVHAADLPACASESLKCEFFTRDSKWQEKELGKETLAFSRSHDRPECSVRMFYDLNVNDTIMINLDEESKSVRFTVIDRVDGPLYQRGTGATFSVRKNEKFYFMHDNQVARCELIDSK